MGRGEEIGRLPRQEDGEQEAFDTREEVSGRKQERPAEGGEENGC